MEDTGRAVLELVTRYADTWRLLLEYDEDRLEAPAGTRPPSAALDHEQAVAAIADFRAALIARGEASALFGNPRGEALEGILGNVEQTMFGEPLYRTREEKAANLLYFLVKDHVGPSDRELAGGAGGVSSFAESEVETAALETGGGAWADDRGGVCAVLAGGGSENLWQPVARKEDQRS